MTSNNKKVSIFGPTLNNRTLCNRTFMAHAEGLSAVKKQSNYDIPSLLGSSGSTSNLLPDKKEEPEYINPEDYFRKVLKLTLLCFKCKKLYTDPIACYKCSKIYCNSCLDWELENHSRCLHCFNIIFKEIAERVNEDLMEEYDKNEVKCPYKKCKEVANLRNIREHIENCLYKDNTNDINRLEHMDKVVCFDNQVYLLFRMIYMFKIIY